jgi:ATP-dependent helicase/nuclease subunit B
MRVITTRYGAQAYAALSEEVARLKAGDPLAFVTIVVPSQLVAVTARRHLAAGRPDAPGIAAVELVTPRRLADRLAAPTAMTQGRRPAVPNVVVAAARTVLRDAPGTLEPVAAHDATIRALVAAHRELRDLTADALDRVATASPLTADVVRLHRHIVELMAPDWYDERDLLAEAAATLRTLAVTASTVLFLPVEPTRAEQGLIAALDGAGTLSVIAGQTGVARLDRWLATIDDALALDDNDPSAIGVPLATAVFHASDADDETRCVVRHAVQTLRATPSHRVAILWSSREPYARLLAEHLDAAGVRWHGSGVIPLVERNVSRAVLGLLGLAIDGLRRDAMFAWLAGASARDDNGQRVPVQRWERLSRTAAVIDEDDWEPRLDVLATRCRAEADNESASPDARDWLVDKLRRQAEDADQLRDFAVSLRSRLTALRGLTTWPQMAGWLDAARREVLGLTDDLTRLPDAELAAALRVRSHIGGLDALISVEPRARLQDLYDGLNQQLSDDLPTHGRPGDGLYVGPISAAAGLNAEVVYVVGLSDDQYPGRFAEDALLPDEARALSDGQLRDLRDRLDRRHRDLLTAFSAAPSVIASFPRGDLRRSHDRLPSRWLLPTLRAITGDQTLAATRWEAALGVAAAQGQPISGSPSYALSVSTTAAPASEQEWRQRAAAGGDALINDAIVVAGRELLTARRSPRLTRYDGLVGAGVPDPTATGKPISPTSFERWVHCPFGYFMERMLGVSPVESPEDLLRISPLDVGNVIHRSLEDLLNDGEPPAPGVAWSDAQRARLQSIARDIGAQYQAEGLTGHPVLWAQDQAGILVALDRALANDDAYRAGRGARWESAELPFGRKGVPAVTVALPDGSTLAFTGYADRVDRLADGSLVVVDIKSGKASGFSQLDATDPTARGSKLQLPVYGLAARAAKGSPSTPVHAEYWFVGRDLGKRIGYEVTDEVLTEYARVLAVIVDGLRGGLFPMIPVAPSTWSAWVDCPYCDPDGLGTTERHRQWLAKAADPALSDYLDLVES